MKRIALLLLIPLAVEAQTTINGGRIFKGTLDASGAASTLPYRTGTGSPVGRDNCGKPGETYFQTDAQPGQNVWGCTVAGTPGTWNQLSAAQAGGGAVSSVFGRTGSITGQTGDYTAAQVTNAAQTNASNTFTAGTQDFHGAAHTLPAVTGLAAARPATCAVGEMYFATDATSGQNWYYCTATNVWTQQTFPAAPVPTVFGRTGSVIAQSGDYTAAQVTNAAQTNAANTFTAGKQDLSGATHTLPARVGTAASRPATCTIGEMYFATDATAGQNWYYCTAANTWTAQAIGIPDTGSNGVVVRTAQGTTAARSLTAGPGITIVNPDGVAGSPAVSINTAIGLTNANAQANKPWFCTSTTGNTVYACSLSAAPLTAYTAGMCVDLLVDTSNSGAATLNIDSLGAKAIKIGDGVTDPMANQIVAGRETRVCYDGTVFRLPTAVPLANISLNGVSQGTYSALNLVSATGVNWTLTPNGQTLGIVPAPDTTYLLSQTAAQNGTPFVCAPASNSGTAYACSLSPSPTSLTNGMIVQFRPDVSCAGGVTTLNVNALGVKPVYALDGASNPAPNDCRTNRPTWLMYSTGLNGGNGAYVIQSVANLPAAAPTGTTVPFSATPTFTVTGPIQEFTLTLAGNVTSSTLAGAVVNGVLIFQICQDSTGGRTFTWPSGFSLAVSISLTASSCTKQQFVWDGANANPTAPATSTDTPFLISGASERSSPATPATGVASLWPDSSRHTWASMENNSPNTHIMPRTAGGSDQLSSTDLSDTPTLVRNNASNAAGPGMTLDLSAATGANALKVPVGAGLTSGADGAIAYDSTSKNTHIRSNGADAIAAAVTGTVTNNDCAKFSVSNNNVQIVDAGSGCGGGGGGYTAVPGDYWIPGAMNTLSSYPASGNNLQPFTGSAGVGANGVVAYKVFVPITIGPTALTFYVVTPGSSTCQTSVGIYNSAGNLVVYSGLLTSSTTVPCNGTQGTRTLTTSSNPAATLGTLTPGYYWIASTSNETTGQIQSSPIETNIGMLLNVIVAHVGYASNAATNGALPATLPSLSGSTFYLPLLALSK